MNGIGLVPKSQDRRVLSPKLRDNHEGRVEDFLAVKFSPRRSDRFGDGPWMFVSPWALLWHTGNLRCPHLVAPSEVSPLAGSQAAAGSGFESLGGCCRNCSGIILKAFCEIKCFL